MTEQNMNEQIRELAEQAGMTLKPRRLYDDNEPDGYLESDLDFLDNNLEATRVFFEGGLEKFAELIVRECARIVPNTDLGDVDGGDSAVLRAASKQIREHFGVE
jgi:hypothetical protein